jgi:hypothetical protein
MAPVVENGVVIHYGTHDACQYPTGFCRNLARLFLSHRNGNFVEFFSGPKAPLTESVKTLMVERRAASLLTVFEAPTPVLQQAVQVVADQEPLGEPLMTSGRLHQKQRTWSSDHQLIPDGLTSPLHHLAMAKRLKHPLRTWDDLPAGLLQAVNFVVAMKTTIQKLREVRMEELRSKALELEDERKATALEAGETFKKLGSPIHIPLLRWLISRCDAMDKADLLLLGMPVVGAALRSPYFEDYNDPAKRPLRDLFSSSPARRKGIIERVARDGRADPVRAQIVWDKTQQEIAERMCSGPFSPEEASLKFGPWWNCVRRFALSQGMDGVDQKWRVIDDHTEAGNNLAAGRSQKIPMSSIGQALNLSRAVALHLTGHEDRPLLISEDLKSAYRQIPLLSSQTMLCLLAVLCTTTGTAFLFEPFAQPLGSASAVPNFYRCADMICELGQKYLSLCMDHFFDDFWVIEPEYAVASAQTALRGLLDVLGFKWDPRKSQGPTDSGTILGVQLDLTRARDSLLTARPKPGRVESVQKEILATLESGRLPGSQSARIAGKAEFLSTTMFGKVGKCCLASLKARQYAEHKKAALTPWLQASLQCLYVLIGEAPPHTINFRCEETDAP